MATIDSKSIIDELIANNGNYEDDPPVIRIVEYTNSYGNTTWGVIWQGQDPDRYEASQYVRNPKIIFERK